MPHTTRHVSVSSLPTGHADPARPRPGQRHVRWIVVVLALFSVLGGLAWYLRERPASSLRETIGSIGRPDAMSVEAIAEGGSSIVGRNVSIIDARVTQVTGDRTFWVAGREGPHLLVVIAPLKGSDNPPVVRVRSGDRLQLNGVVREGVRDGLSPDDRAQVQKASVYLVAAEILKTHGAAAVNP